ncbi:RDD family protein [Streptomyces sp. RB110-1]|uniref:RDD family protein n=1 Tax=unclassified Streptomyces TaxID=2593676 RepID=UPI0018FFFDB2|nr:MULTISPECIES: RDD family protein [unclassified Streptomyces]MBK0376747.1 RDD family protein [Streptomyces sp. RB110-1]MBK0386879.1 RDD family protein [Streptomyces sp. RB110-2]
MSAPTPAPGDESPREGYYPDPSIPGYVRYWNGASWVPGTSRPAPAAPAPAAPAVRDAPAEETGPIFFDEEEAALQDGPGAASPAQASPGAAAGGSGEPAARPGDSASVWQADAARQTGFGGERDHRVDWPDPAGEPAPESRRSAPPADPRAPLSPDPAAGGALPAMRDGGGRPAAAPAATRPPTEGTVTLRASGARNSAPGSDVVRFGSPQPEPAAPAPAAPAEPAAPQGPQNLSAARHSIAPAPEPRALPAAARPTSPQVSPAQSQDRPTPHQAQGAQSAQAHAAHQAPPHRQSHLPAQSHAPQQSQQHQQHQPSLTPQQPPMPQPPHPSPAPQQSQPPHQVHQPQQALSPSRPHYPQPYAPVQQASLPQAAAPGQLPASAPALPDPVRTPSAAPAPHAAPHAPGPGGGPASWAQQGPGSARPEQPHFQGADQPVVPWKPPVDDPFQQLARDQASARPAGLGKRFAARLVDNLVLGAVVGAAAIPLTVRALDHIDRKITAAKETGETVTVWLLDSTTGSLLGALLAAFLLLGFLLEALPTAKWGRTLGKKLFGLDVRDIESHETPSLGAALRRWLVYGVLGLVVLGVVNVLWCLFDRPWRQCWHDKAARTFVAG